MSSPFSQRAFADIALRWAAIAKSDPRRPLRVTFTGKQAFAAEDQVNLPSFPAGTLLNPTEWNCFNGYLDHELAHHRFTDLQLFQSVAPRLHPTCRLIWNILEDIRCENLQIQIFIGSRKYLDRVHFELDHTDDLKTDPNHPTVQIYSHAYCEYRNLNTGVYPDRLEVLYPSIATAMKEIPSCSSTTATLELAKRIYDLMRQEQQQKPQQKPQGQQQPGDTGAAGDGEEESEEENDEGGESEAPTGSEAPTEGKGESRENHQEEDEDEEDDEDEGEGEAGEGDAGDEDVGAVNVDAVDVEGENDNVNQPTDDGDNGVKDPNGNDPYDPDSATDAVTNHMNQLAQLISDMAKKISSTFIPDERGRSVLPPKPTIEDKFDIRPERPDIARFNAIRNEQSHQITSLKSAMSTYLMSRARRAWSRGLEEGDYIDRERIHQTLRPGKPAIFKNRRDRSLINTAVELTIDLSASMAEDITTSAAIVLAEALSSVPKIALAITGFSTSADYAYQSIGKTPGVGRIVGIQHFIFKDFDEPYTNCRGALGALRTVACTPLGEAYGKSLEHILHRPEPRRVIWLVSDGQPEFPTGDYKHSDYSLMKTVHKKSQSLGIETLGIEIGIEGLLAPYTDRAVYVDNISNLGRSLLNTISSVIRVKEK